MDCSEITNEIVSHSYSFKRDSWQNWSHTYILIRVKPLENELQAYMDQIGAKTEIISAHL